MATREEALKYLKGITAPAGVAELREPEQVAQLPEPSFGKKISGILSQAGKGLVTAGKRILLTRKYEELVGITPQQVEAELNLLPIEQRVARKIGEEVPGLAASLVADIFVTKGIASRARAGRILAGLSKNAQEIAAAGIGGAAGGFTYEAINSQSESRLPSFSNLAKEVGFGTVASAGLVKIGQILKRTKNLATIKEITPNQKEATEEAIKTTQRFLTPEEAFEINDGIAIKRVNKIGRDLAGKKITSRLEWDRKSKTGTLFISKDTTPTSIAHEFGHFIDKNIPVKQRMDFLANAKGIKKDLLPNEQFADLVGQIITDKKIAKANKGLADLIENEFGVMTGRGEGVKDIIQKSKANKVTLTEALAEAQERKSGIITSGAKVIGHYKAPNTPSINMNTISAPEEVEEMIEKIAREDMIATGKQRRGIVSFEQQDELARMSGVTVQDLLDARPGSITNTENFKASKQIMADAALQVVEFSRGMGINPTAEQLSEFRMMLEKFKGIQRAVAGFRTEAGRLLGSMRRTVVAGENDTMLELAQSLAKSDPKLLDELGLVDEVNKILNPSTIENIIGLWKAGLLTNPATHLANAAGNVIFSTLETLKDIPASVTDNIISMFTGKRTKTVGRLKDIMSGGAKGVEEAVDILKGNSSDLLANKRFDFQKQIRFKNDTIDKTLGNYGRTVFNLLGASDRVFYNSAFKKSLGENAKLIAQKTGQEVDDLIANPTDDMLEIAMNDAEMATFQQDTVLGKIGMSFRKALTFKRVKEVEGKVEKTTLDFGNFILPFVKTPAAIADSMLEYSPIGIPWKFVSQALLNKPITQRTVSEAVGRSITGSGILFFGWQLGRKGIMSGSYPTSESERELWNLAGIQPNSIKIGDKWLSLDKISPFGNILNAGARFQKISETDEDMATKAVSGLFNVGKVMKDQSFLQGFARFVDAFDNPDRSAAAWVEGAVSGTVPSIFRAIARGEDKYVREVDGVADRFLSGIPGMSQSLEARRDFFNEPIKRDSSWYQEMFNIFKPKKSLSSPLISEFTRLKNTGNTPALTVITDRPTIEAFRDRVDGATYNEFLEKTGQELREDMEKEITRKSYLNSTDADKKTKLENIKDSTVEKYLKKYGYGERARKREKRELERLAQ